MKNKKGVVHVGAIIAIVVIIGATAVGAGYVWKKNNTPGVVVGPDGVNVRTNGVNVSTGNDGVNVDADGLGVRIGNDGVAVDVDGSSVNGDSATSEGTEAQVNTILIFDASGSMAERIDGTSRIQLAKNAVADYVRNLDGDVNMSVVAYGHKGNNTQAGKEVSCNGIEEIYYMGPVNASVITGKVNALNPNGWTPIMKSLQYAGDILNKQSTSGQKHIFLLSDGEETCGGDPIAYACSLKDAGITVDVIGLDVDGAVAQQLRSISECGGGQYFPVGSVNDFNVVINNMGVKVNTGDVRVNVSGDGVDVQTGNVDVKTGADGAKVNVDNIKVDTTTGGSPSVSVPGVSIPSF